MCQSSGNLVNLLRARSTSCPASAGVVFSILWFFKKKQNKSEWVWRWYGGKDDLEMYVFRVLVVITSVIYTAVSILLSFWYIKRYIKRLKQLHCDSKIFTCVSTRVTAWALDPLVSLWWMSILIVPQQHPLSHLCDIVHKSGVSISSSTLSRKPAQEANSPTLFKVLYCFSLLAPCRHLP